MIEFPTVRLLIMAFLFAFAGRMADAQPPESEIAVSPVEHGASSTFETQLEEEWRSHIQALLKEHCVKCHGNETSESEVNLELFTDLGSIRSQPAIWDQIRGVVKIGAMPPADEAPLSNDQRVQISNWVENTLHRVDCSVEQPPGHVTIRRLNNTEYDRTIRDLLAIDASPSSKVAFTSDEVGNGFDNQGEVLSLPPLLLEKYMQAAEIVASEAIVLDRESLRKQGKEGESLFVGESCSAEFLFAEGEYQIAFRMHFGDGQNDSVRAKAYIDDVEAIEFEVEPKGKAYEFKQLFSAGVHRIKLVFTEDPQLKEPFKPERRIHVDRIRMEGPTEGLPALPASHRMVIRSEPGENRTVQQAATESFQAFLRRAYRRPAEPIEVQRIVQVVENATSLGLSYPEAMQYGLQAVLVSPPFLFRIEREDGPMARPGARQVGAFDLASRLSYLFWSSMPDDRLMEAAESNRLLDQDTLLAEVDRMLDDPKSLAMNEGFFAQWLGLRNLNGIDVDGQKYPAWSERLRNAMRKETQLFCAHLMSRDGKLGDVIDADFTFVNPRLAEFYGLQFDGKDPKEMYQGRGFQGRRSPDRRPGVYTEEDRWVRTALPAARRGMLTQASILTLTSNPSRTSPVKRGKWILENILGDPPPPAPPNVPSLEESAKEHQNIPLRQQLEIHRKNPSCASCHKVMDPIGLGLENFNAIGQWREEDQGSKIEASGTLADGREFSGAVQLLEALGKDQPKIARHFARKLLTYALGRGLTTSDECAVDKIVLAAQSDEYKIRAFVRAVVMSEPFRLLPDKE